MYPNTPKPRPTTAIQTPRRPVHPVHTRATKLSSAAKNPNRNHAGTDTDAIPKPNETTASALLGGGCVALAAGTGSDPDSGARVPRGPAGRSAVSSASSA